MFCAEIVRNSSVGTNGRSFEIAVDCVLWLAGWVAEQQSGGLCKGLGELQSAFGENAGQLIIYSNRSPMRGGAGGEIPSVNHNTIHTMFTQLNTI